MRDLVSERRRGRYFAHRTRLTTITTFVALVTCGLILHELDTGGRTYLGFVVIFLIAFVARTISVYHLTFLHEPPPTSPGAGHAHRALVAQPAVDRRDRLLDVRRADEHGGRHLVAVLHGLHAARPRLSYFEFTVLSGTSVIVQFLMLTTWGRIADVYGNRLILIVTSISLPIVPLLWLFSDNFWALLVFQALSGLSWSGFTL